MGDDSDLDKLREAAQRNADMIDASAAFVAIFNDAMRSDPIPLMQMGLAIYLDKPIALLVPEGADIPNNLRKVAQRIEYFKRDPNDMQSFERAADRLMTWMTWNVEQKGKE